MEKSSPVNWLYLVAQDEETQNIRVHQLEETDNLPELLDEFSTRNYAKAVVLINTEDNYVLGDFVSHVKEVPVPTIIVTRSDGEAILKYVDQYNGEGIYAQVEAENQVDQDTERGQPVQDEPQQKALETSIGLGKSETA